MRDHQDAAGPVTNNGQTAEMSTAVWGRARLRIGYLTLVSAVRQDGRTRFTRIRSLAEEPCRLVPGLPGPYDVRSTRGRAVQFRDLGDGTLQIDLRAGDEVIVFSRGTDPGLTVAPVRTDGSGNVWELPTG